MFRQVLLFILSLIILSCNSKKIDIVTPEKTSGLLYKNNFDSKQPIEEGSYIISKKIHKNSLYFRSVDSSYTSFKKEIKPKSSFGVTFWFKPDFFGRNGSIITLSQELKDFPIEAVLSIFMNKNRIAIMQGGKDLRKENFKNQNKFTPYFMSLKELDVSEIYFLTYLYEDNSVTILLDGEKYAKYENVPKLGEFNYITLGASWNKNGTKFFFNGAIDDLYMYDKILNKKDIYNIMNYTHVYQYAK